MTTHSRGGGNPQRLLTILPRPSYTAENKRSKIERKEKSRLGAQTDRHPSLFFSSLQTVRLLSKLLPFLGSGRNKGKVVKTLSVQLNNDAAYIQSDFAIVDPLIFSFRLYQTEFLFKQEYCRYKFFFDKYDVSSLHEDLFRFLINT